MKSLFKHTIASLVAVALIGAAVSAQAQTNSTKSSEGTPKAKHDTTKFSGKVASVDKAGMTVTVENKTDGPRTFQVSSTTQITKEGKPITLGDLTAGEKIGGSYKKTADGKMEATTLRVGGKAKSETPSEPAKTEAPKSNQQ